VPRPLVVLPPAAALPPTPPPTPPSSVGGLRLLESANRLLPQGALVATARTGWRLAWQALVRELAPQSKEGAYQRPGYAFRGRIPQQPSSAAANATTAASSYALYVGNACPWCHRALLVLALREMRGDRGLVRVVDLVDDPERATRGGWVVAPSSSPEPVFGARDLFGVYDAASPGFRGRCTAPLLIDARARSPVCNESAEIVRNLVELKPPPPPPTTSSPRSSATVTTTTMNRADLFPEQHRAEIDRLNTLIYDDLANAVYRAGFATTQSAYDQALGAVRRCLAVLEALLEERRFLCGDVLTEADVRLFPALCRMDAVYHPFFLRGAPLRDGSSGGGRFPSVGGLAAVFPNLHGWLNEVWELPGVSATIDVSEARRSYWNLFPLNAGGIVPPGPTEEQVRRGAGGEPGSEVAARRRSKFGGREAEAPPRSAEDVCATFSV
jgi:glutathionyl-hydroquinone reductase